ncbi:MAG: D-Ala-D-Ala carboxypeptidase family metallohydrolase [Devosia sp.]
MRLAVLAIACLALLSGCAFAPRDLYAPYRSNFGTYVANSGVDTFCLVPKLRLAIGAIEARFGRKVVVSSGYRDPSHNARVGGKDDSFHMKCMAADIFIPGVSKRSLIAVAYREGLVGGLGCYPGRTFIHIDVRDRPRGWNRPVTFSGC